MRAAQNIQVGSQVKFTNDADQDNQFEITVIELNGDRCIIRTDIGWGNLNPTSVVMVSDLRPE